MLLSIDIGNSNITAGLFKGSCLISTQKLVTDRGKKPEYYSDKIHSLFNASCGNFRSVEGTAIACVVPDMVNLFGELIQRNTGKEAFFIRGDTESDIENRYDEPVKLGADRLANAVCLWKEYGSPSCSVDLGTATNFEVVVDKGIFSGGAIAPGFAGFIEELKIKTAQLPEVEAEPPPSIVATNTINSIQAGVYWGYISLLEGMIRRFRNELKVKLKVIGTGGWVHFFASGTQIFDAVDPFLTLKGIRYLLESNNLRGKSG